MKKASALKQSSLEDYGSAAAAPGSDPEYVYQIGGNDILMGRGIPMIKNEGNVRFRQLARTRKQEYIDSRRHSTKHEIALEVVKEISNRKGRFLSELKPKDKRALGMSEDKKVWKLVDFDTAIEKVKQALRDKEPDDRKAPQPPPNLLHSVLADSQAMVPGVATFPAASAYSSFQGLQRGLTEDRQMLLAQAISDQQAANERLRIQALLNQQPDIGLLRQQHEAVLNQFGSDHANLSRAFQTSRPSESSSLRTFMQQQNEFDQARRQAIVQQLLQENARLGQQQAAFSPDRHTDDLLARRLQEQQAGAMMGHSASPEQHTARSMEEALARRLQQQQPLPQGSIADLLRAQHQQQSLLEDSALGFRLREQQQQQALAGERAAMGSLPSSILSGSQMDALAALRERLAEQEQQSRLNQMALLGSSNLGPLQRDELARGLLRSELGQPGLGGSIDPLTSLLQQQRVLQQQPNRGEPTGQRRPSPSSSASEQSPSSVDE